MLKSKDNKKLRRPQRSELKFLGKNETWRRIAINKKPTSVVCIFKRNERVDIPLGTEVFLKEKKKKKQTQNRENNKKEMIFYCKKWTAFHLTK